MGTVGWLTIRQAADRKRVSRTTIYRWIREGKVASHVGPPMHPEVWWPDVEKQTPRGYRAAR